MALFDNGIKLGTGLALGVGAVILVPVLIPAVGAVVRPMARAAIKGGLILVERTRELAAEAAETISDIKAEAEAELAAEKSASFSTPGEVEEV